MPDIFLYSGEASPNDVRLRDPTISGAAGAYTLDAASGSIVLTGTAATLRAGRNVVAASGAFALTGQAATLLRALLLPAASGALSLSGQAATLARGYRLTASPGAYTLTGQPATLTYAPVVAAYTLTAASGAFILAGYEVTLSVTPAVQPVVGGGAWAPPRREEAKRPPTVHGEEVTLLRGRVLRAEPGTVERVAPVEVVPVRARVAPVEPPVAPVVSVATVVAQPATPAPAPLTHHTLVAKSVAYGLTGNVVQLRHGRRLAAEPATLDPSDNHPFTDDDMLAVLLLLAA